ncbi:hypothetical protein EGR_09674 [Echinococcus granulosus]|uniref:Uncharacterized protein n=1 Tax=Echinococcus granulosus TaxID=6210 RepID=W6U4K3_ECHGR|nr:hypothetical protein EGR_09674 [Echinococcus granulosus]EUB55466.1 hypothetical protein EGR_09674 [Echinococcus granulosus]
MSIGTVEAEFVRCECEMADIVVVIATLRPKPTEPPEDAGIAIHCCPFSNYPKPSKKFGSHHDQLSSNGAGSSALVCLITWSEVTEMATLAAAVNEYVVQSENI